MFWTDNTNRVAGILVLLFLALTLIAIFTSFSYSEENPFDRSEVDEFITDINENEATAIVSVVFDNAANVTGLLLAAAIYLVFRERNRTLALFAFAGIFAAAVASMGVAAGQETLIILADDFHAGGAGELEAGSDVTLEVARAVAMFSFVLEQIAATAMGVGLLALGTLIARSPVTAGAAPPR